MAELPGINPGYQGGEPGAPSSGFGAAAEAPKPAAKPRSVKTPLQKEVLEASYQMNAHPTEEHRRALGERIGLTEAQVQVWYTNRRRKDKVSEQAKAAAAAGAGALPPATAAAAAGAPLLPAAAGMAPTGAAPVMMMSQPLGLMAMAPAAAYQPPVITLPRGLPTLVTLPSQATAAPPLPPPSLQLQQPVYMVPSTHKMYAPAVSAPHHLASVPMLGYVPAPLAGANYGGGGAVAAPAVAAHRSAVGEGGAGGQMALEDEEGGALSDDNDVDDGTPPPHPQFTEFRELLQAAKATLPVPYREDGPPLGYVFDEPLPPGAAPAAGGAKRKRIVMGDFVAEANEEGITGIKKRKLPYAQPLPPGMTAAQYEETMVLQKQRELEALEVRQRQEEARMAREGERNLAMQKRMEALIQKEQERLRREMLRHQERLDRERQREEEDRRREGERAQRDQLKFMEKAEKERLRDEARRMREYEKARAAQERESRKMEARLEKEKKMEERKQMMEERRREKEVQKALQHQERKVTRMRQRDAAFGPPDDEDVEWERLVAAQRAAAPPDVDLEALPPPQRPPFPPPALGLSPAFPAELGAAGGAQLLTAWMLLSSFPDVLGVKPVSLDALVTAVLSGQGSQLLSDIHIAMLQLMLADMEEAHAASSVPQGPGPADRAISGAASLLEEALCWGFDIESWRAHLHYGSWPEVLRQAAIVAGAGRKRPKPKRDGKGRLVGKEGEDVVGAAAGGPDGEAAALRLQLPDRFQAGSVKAAIWQVLAEAGAEGMTIIEMVQAIQSRGIRDLSTTKTPEATIAGALSRDVIFHHLPRKEGEKARYALQAVVTHAKKQERLRKQADAAAATTASAATAAPAAATAAFTTAPQSQQQQQQQQQQDEKPAAAPGVASGQPAAPAAPSAAPTTTTAPSAPAGAGPMDIDSAGPAGKHTAATGAIASQQAPAAAATEAGGALATTAADRPPAEEGAEEEYADEEEEEEEEAEERQQRSAAASIGEHWVTALLESDYDALSPVERAAALNFLCHTVLDGPTARGRIEARVETRERVKKQLWDQAKQDKRQRQVEAAGKAQAAAEMAVARLEELRATAAGMPPPPRPATAQLGDGSAAAASGGSLSGPKVIIEELFRDPSLLLAYDALSVSHLAMEAAAQRHKIEMDEEERARRQARGDTLRKVEDENAIRMEPLGSDRRHNRYWHCAVSPSAAVDPSAGRILVELAADGSWLALTSQQQLDGLKAALDAKGLRESELMSNLLRVEGAIRAAQPAQPLPSASLSPLGAAPGLAELLARCRTQADALVAPAAGGSGSTGAESRIPSTDPPQLRKIKTDLLRVARALPLSAVGEPLSDLAAWSASVAAAPDVAALRTCLGQLEESVRPDFVSAGFMREPLLVKGAWLPTGSEVASARLGADGDVQELADSEKVPPESLPPEAKAPLGWLPQTAAALSHRLSALDANLMYRNRTCGRDYLGGYKYIVRPLPLLRPPTSVFASANTAALTAADEAAAATEPTPPGPAVSTGLRMGYGTMLMTVADVKKRDVRRFKFPSLPLDAMAGPREPFECPLQELKDSLAAPQGASGSGAKGKGGKAGKGGSAALPPVPPARGKAADKRGGGGGKKQAAAAAGSRAAAAGRSGAQVVAQRQLSAGLDSEAEELDGTHGTATPVSVSDVEEVEEEPVSEEAAVSDEEEDMEEEEEEEEDDDDGDDDDNEEYDG